MQFTDSEVLDFSPMLLFPPYSPYLSLREAALANASHAVPAVNFTVWARDDIPDRLHYKNNRRTPPLVALADEGWSITTHANSR